MGLLDGKVALITGVARGQGRSHAVRLAEEGADIIGIDVCRDIPTARYPGATPDDLVETADAVEKLGRAFAGFEADVRDIPALREAVRTGVGRLGRLDIVCTNAGIMSLAPAIEVTESEWSETIAINLTGVWNTVQASLEPLFSQQTGGSIILVSSIAGLKGVAHAYPYVAAKHGVTGLARSLANELGPHGIRVNSVHPTTVATPMVLNESTFRYFRPDLEDPSADDVTELLGRRHSLSVPWVEAADVSEAVLWLASDASRYVNGIALPVDAGRLES